MRKSLFIKVLPLALITMFAASCGETSEMRTIRFNTNTTFRTNNVLDQTVKVGGKIKKPAVTVLEDNPDKYKVYAWYTESTLNNVWDFKHDVVSTNMTLYAEWKKTYTVNYYVGDREEPENTITVFEGETIKEHPDYAIGYSYLGSYIDPDYQTPFDYSSGIHADTNIYMKKSDGIDLYEGNPAGGLYDNLEMFSATNLSSTPEVPEIGSISRTNDKEAVFLDFGYSPDIGDPFVEFALNCDIRNSQVLHFVMKHFGAGKTLSFYFTTLLDDVNFNYSVTGANYNENFTCFYEFKENEINMTEDDEYVDIAIDLAAHSFYNGYSVWGTSPYLGKIRIQPSYVSKSKEDRSNTMLLKRIYGTNEGYENGVETKDSESISSILTDSTSIKEQDAQPMGFVFPKDYSFVSSSETASTYKKENGLLMYFTNEIEMRKRKDRTQSVTLSLPKDGNGDVIGDKIVGLEENRNLSLTLTNLGYASSLRIIVENDYGGKTFTTIKLDRKMVRSKDYSINLSKESLMIETLSSITFEYESVGVDNAILLEDIYFGETRPLDIPGFSFDDKYVFGLTASKGQADIAYSAGYSSTEIDVKSNDVELVSTKNNISMTNLGYYGLSLNYSKSKNSNIEGVYVSLFVNGKYGSEYYFETPSITKSSSTVELKVEEGGTITNVRFRFKGTGVIRLGALQFEVDNTYCFDLSHDMSSGAYSDWSSNYLYSYDDARTSSIITADPSAASYSISFYLGIGNRWYGDKVYNCQNLLLSGKTKIVIVYHNGDAAGDLGFIPAYTGKIDTNPDSEVIYERNITTLSLKGNMADYEWDAVTVSIPKSYQSAYLGKVSFRTFPGSLHIRLVAVI